MSLPNSESLDFVSWGLPTEYSVNLSSSPPVDTGALDYVSWGLPASYTYQVSSLVILLPSLPGFTAAHIGRRRSASRIAGLLSSTTDAPFQPPASIFMAPLDQSMPPVGDYFRLARSRWLAAALPKVFAPVTPPGQEAEVIYLPAHWQQEAFKPAHIKARREKQFIATVAQAGWFHGSFVFDAFTTFGVQRNLAHPGVPVYFEVTLKTSSGSIAAHARLYSITGMAVVASSDITTTSTSAARVRSTSLTLDAAATEYRVEFGGQAGMGATFTIYTADLIFGG